MRLVGAATVETRRLMLLARFIITGRDLPVLLGMLSNGGLARRCRLLAATVVPASTIVVVGRVDNYRQTSAGCDDAAAPLRRPPCYTLTTVGISKTPY